MRILHLLKRSLCLLLSALLLASGCAQRTPVLVATPEDGADADAILVTQLRPGDEVDIRFASGGNAAFRVLGILPDALLVESSGGEGHRLKRDVATRTIPFADIASVELVDTSRGDDIIAGALGLTFVGLFVAVGVGLVLLADALHDSVQIRD